MKTIFSKSEGIYKEKGSKFMAYLFPVRTEDEVKAALDTLKQEHAKARHHCYAFRLGSDGSHERANDAGEPNGSAGLPILNQLHSAELTNALLVVVRYFGGTKLGLGGLVTAYKEASKDAIANNRLRTFVVKHTLKITCDINELGNVERLIRMGNWTVEEAKYDLPCHFVISFPASEKALAFERFSALKNVEISV